MEQEQKEEEDKGQCDQFLCKSTNHTRNIRIKTGHILEGENSELTEKREETEEKLDKQLRKQTARIDQWKWVKNIKDEIRPGIYGPRVYESC